VPNENNHQSPQRGPMSAASAAAGSESSPVHPAAGEKSGIETSSAVESEAADTSLPEDTNTAISTTSAAAAAAMVRTTAQVSPNTSLEEASGSSSPKVEPKIVTAPEATPEKPLLVSSSSPAVSPEAAPPHEDPKLAAPPESPKTPEPAIQKPETTVSLDEEEDVSDLEKSPPGSGPETIDNVSKLAANDDISVRAEPGEDDEDSSNDDSSYFNDPIHLPEPGSGRRFSVSSNASAGNNSATRQYPTHAKGRESDASLSLSEDSDDDHHHKQHPMYSVYQQPFPQQPMMFNPQQPQPQFIMPQQQQQQPGGVPELYPKQLTRMHSYNSLVSSSQNSDDEESPSDTSVRDELRSRIARLGTPRRMGVVLPSSADTPRAAGVATIPSLPVRLP